MLSVKKIILVFLLFLTITPLIAQASYVSTGRDTQENPATITDIPSADYDALGYAKLSENDNFTFYWQEQRDVLVVYDKRNGYTWKSGLDVDTNSSRTAQSSTCKDLKRDYNNDVITYDEFEQGCAVTVDQITGTTTGPLLANSLLYFEYFSKGASDSVYQINTVYSSYLKSTLYKVSSTLQKVNNNNNTWRFTISSTGLGVDKDLDLQIVAYLNLSEEGFQLVVNNEDLSGTALPYLSSIGLATYLGAVGGINYEFSTTEKTLNDLGDYDYTEVQADMVDGYSFVPDGSGALIRFLNNSVSLSKYQAYVYGQDPSQSIQSYRSWTGDYVPFKTASIPVYGIAHGNNQAAYVAYASSGDPYMYIISTPEENVYHYNYTHAKFNYHYLYEKLYTLDGDNPVSSISETMNVFDIVMNYDFLAGDGTSDSYPANYVGMALKYKDFLKSENILSDFSSDQTDIGIRLDFLMADSENSIVGYQTQVATTASNVESILNQIIEMGITNISSGLIGWQKNGVTIGDPTKATFSSAVGSKTAYKNLIETFLNQGIDISFYQDYYSINEQQVSLYRNASKHPAGWYARLMTYEDPIYMFYYARPLKSVEWLNNQSDTFIGMGVRSITVDGISAKLITDYTGDTTSRLDAILLYQEAFSSLTEDVMVNLTKPNMYLFPYTDRYLQMNVYSTQYLIETDTVPFLQILLQGTMELYAVYSNFSFYTDSDVLRMIDYNVYPSFVLTQQPAFVLSDTNSSEYYSTEYVLYSEMINSIYSRVNNALSSVINATWINREVLELGVVKNTYDNGVSII
ncbi:MAG: DUF5696 domain-containing protein, partial [Candidatus Izemoplasmatales bacterium]|nr:DUF5696 domain-containing protein [Candidatus Izemoplasmatales bacterium]